MREGYLGVGWGLETEWVKGAEGRGCHSLSSQLPRNTKKEGENSGKEGAAS